MKIWETEEDRRRQKTTNRGNKFSELFDPRLVSVSEVYFHLTLVPHGHNLFPLFIVAHRNQELVMKIKERRGRNRFLTLGQQAPLEGVTRLVQENLFLKFPVLMLETSRPSRNQLFHCKFIFLRKIAMKGVPVR